MEDIETAFRLYDEEEKGKITFENLKRVSQEVKLLTAAPWGPHP